MAITVSLDVLGAFGSAWWLTIVKGLGEAECPRNLYYLTQDYLKETKAIITTSNISMEMKITEDCPQGSCCRPGLLNIQFDPCSNSNIQSTKAEAFADDLLIMIRAESVGKRKI